MEDEQKTPLWMKGLCAVAWAAISGALWAVNVCTRFAVVIGILWLFPDAPESVNPLLSEARASDLAAAIIVPMIAVIFLWEMMRNAGPGSSK